MNQSHLSFELFPPRSPESEKQLASTLVEFTQKQGFTCVPHISVRQDILTNDKNGIIKWGIDFISNL